MLEGIRINIVGPNALQNVLLSTFIEKETSASCNIINSRQINNILFTVTQKISLTLIDSHGEDVEKALLVQARCLELGPANQIIAFFNVGENSALESAAIPPCVRGLFFVDTSKENFIKGLIAIFNGDLWYPRRVISRYLINNNQEGKQISFVNNQNVLTRREIQILNMLTTGAKNIDIADNLCLSVHTIKTHIYHIYKKIDVNNRTEAVQWAYSNL